MEILKEIAPIAGLLVVIAIVMARLPKVEIEHSKAFLARRRVNWIILGLTYAFLYFGRYNLSVAKTALDSVGMTNEVFGTIFGVGSIVYGCAFLINGPLCDKLGGRTTLLIGAVGSAIVNGLMGLFLLNKDSIGIDLPLAFTVLYGFNMYFQSFGAVSIVKVNSAWFHVRERGIIGGISRECPTEARHQQNEGQHRDYQAFHGSFHLILSFWIIVRGISSDHLPGNIIPPESAVPQ
jgi:OPA family glycerol-3-phosphate transporter-like MFS transporter